MAQIRDIKDRIESVKKTKKITQAMKMVAAAKFKRASAHTTKTRDYMKALKGTLSAVIKHSHDAPSPLMLDNGAKNDVAIVITGDRGLCGGFNTNIIKFAEGFLREQTHNTSLVLFGDKGYVYFKNRQWPIEKAYSKFVSQLSLDRVHEVLAPIVSQFQDGKIGRVWLFYNEFASALSSNLSKVQLLPVVVDDGADDDPGPDYFYEPDQGRILNDLLQSYLRLSVYRAFIESTAAEEGARMAAMDAATDNAGEMIRSLTLLFNRSRQAQITTELSEIVAGAESLSQ